MYGPDKDVPMCGDFYDDILQAKFLSEAISIALSVFNQILRTVVILIIS